MHRRGFLVVPALAALLLLQCSPLPNQIAILPQHVAEDYETQIPLMLDTARMSHTVPAPIDFNEDLLVLPVVYEFASASSGPNRILAEWWQPGPQVGAVRTICNDAYEMILKRLQDEGFAGRNTADMKNARGKVEDLAVKHVPEPGKDATGNKIPAYTYSSWNLGEWPVRDIMKYKQAMPNVGGVLQLVSHGTWIYQGHVAMNNEGVAVFNVEHWHTVTFCRRDACTETRIPKTGGLHTMMTMPAYEAIDKQRRALNDQSSWRLVAKINSEIAMLAFNEMVKPLAVGIPGAIYQVGDKVLVAWGGAWYRSDILVADQDRYKVVFEGQTVDKALWTSARLMKKP